MLMKLRIYDDTVLWNLLVSMPIVFISIRLINLQLSFNYDDLKTCKQNEAEYFLANMIKKAYIEDAIELYEAKRLTLNEEFEVQNFRMQKMLQVLLFSSGTIALILFGHMVPNERFNQSLPRLFIIFGLVMVLGTYFATRQFHKTAPFSLYRISLLGSLVSLLGFLMSCVVNEFWWIVVTAVVMIASNSIGMFTFTSSFNYVRGAVKLSSSRISWGSR